MAHYSPFEGTHLYLNSGFYIVEENDDEKDPKLTAVQAGFASEVIPNLKLGLRGSGFFYASVDAPGGTSLLGELADDGNIFAADTDRVSIVEVRGHVVYSGITGWPITLYGTWAENTNADGINAGVLGNSNGEDTAWGAGIEIGDKKEWVMIGFGWFHIEANALIDSFIDSDLFDGKTNRQGLVAYAER